jgi:uncharacterized protein YegP (UPF0339 family)
MHKYQIVRSVAVSGLFYFTLRSGRNGKVIMTSQMYKQRRSCDRASLDLRCVLNDFNDKVSTLLEDKNYR